MWKTFTVVQETEKAARENTMRAKYTYRKKMVINILKVTTGPVCSYVPLLVLFLMLMSNGGDVDPVVLTWVCVCSTQVCLIADPFVYTLL